MGHLNPMTSILMKNALRYDFIRQHENRMSTIGDILALSTARIIDVTPMHHVSYHNIRLVHQSDHAFP